MKTVKVFQSHEWDKLVSKHYGRPYNFQQQDGCKGNGVHEFKVPDITFDHHMHDKIPETVGTPMMGIRFDSWLKRDPEQLLPDMKERWARDMWWERNFYPDFQTVANDLHGKGLLEAGEYMIIID